MKLDDVRESVRTLRRSQRAIPTKAMLELSAAAQGKRVTVDLAASRTLGFPLFVVRASNEPSFFVHLSNREREVARLLAAGRCNKDIATQLAISLGTVKDHVHAVLKKSGLTSRLEVATAFMSGTIE
jgi:two-component system, NarL family, nitrate/nitrite response regulator NarL